MKIDFLKKLRNSLQRYNVDEVPLTVLDVNYYLDYLEAKDALLESVTEYSEYISNPLQDKVDEVLDNYKNIKHYNVRVGKTSEGPKMRIYSWPKQRKYNSLSKIGE